jgi:hypothetical protein
VSVAEELREDLAHPLEAARRTEEEYAGGEPRPLGSYVGAMAVYGAGVLGLTALGRRRHVAPPERVAPWDLFTVAVATHKLSRMLAKDAVTSPLRAPFVRFEGQSGPAELSETVRTDNAVRHGVGELLTCPYCLAQWVATGFVAGLVLAPRATRLAAATFSAVAASDFLQVAYSRASV